MKIEPVSTSGKPAYPALTKAAAVAAAAAALAACQQQQQQQTALPGEPPPLDQALGGVVMIQK